MIYNRVYNQIYTHHNLRHRVPLGAAFFRLFSDSRTIKAHFMGLMIESITNQTAEGCESFPVPSGNHQHPKPASKPAASPGRPDNIIPLGEPASKQKPASKRAEPAPKRADRYWFKFRGRQFRIARPAPARRAKPAPKAAPKAASRRGSIEKPQQLKGEK
jgi:hypothetical protein